MGQRNQLFLVARVCPNPGKRKEHRCVAAFHHQWCYGKLPLRCVSRFRDLARVKANADLIQRDLDRYHLGVERSSEIPCPYISFLASTAFSMDIERRYGEPYVSGIRYLPVFGSMDGDNNDGITVIDISTPSNLSYCFVSTSGLEAAKENNVPRCIPLTASQFLRAYYPINLDPLANRQEAEVYNAMSIKNLDSMPILRLDVLNGTWPGVYSQRIIDSYAGSSGNVSIESKSGAESIGVFQDPFVDLSNLNFLPEKLLDMLESFPSFTHLNVSHNSAMDKATLSEILRRYRLKWLSIDGCNISKEDITDLLVSQPSLFRGIEVIIHPLFLSLDNLDRWAIDMSPVKNLEPSSIPCALRIRYDDVRHLCLSFFSIDQLVQNLLDFAEAHESFPRGFRLNQIIFQNLQCLFGCTSRGDGQPWRERVVQMIPPEARGEGNQHGYQFIFISDSSRVHRRGPAPIGLGGYHYGIVLPGNEHKFVDLETFFRHLEGVGWPALTKREAATQVIGIFRERVTLLNNFNAVMKWLDRTEGSR
ncbi:hypothetical protein NMY22_g1976 [Coprinellus aureogranulatus]|nr:hypothetical protein NMY22_g1976 [Coprinellus aureogranulatus]